MADETSNTTPQDAQRVNIHEAEDVQYWCRHFGCTRQQLLTVVQKVGVKAGAVAHELKRR